MHLEVFYDLQINQSTSDQVPITQNSSFLRCSKKNKNADIPLKKITLYNPNARLINIQQKTVVDLSNKVKNRF